MKISVVVATVMVGMSAAVAQDSLTLDAALQAALANNPPLAAERMRIDEAKAQLQQAGLLPNPELEVGGRFDNAFNNEGEHSVGLGVSQRFSVSGRIAAQKGKARVSIDRTRAEVGDLERRVVGEARRAFTELLAVDEQLELQEFLKGLNDELLGVTRDALERGQVSEKDVNAIQIALQQTRQRQMILETQRRSRVLELNKLMGQPLEREFFPVSAQPFEVPADFSSFTLEQALTSRPDFAVAQYEVDLAKAEQRLARAERFEDWRLGAGYEREKSVVDGTPPQNVDQFIGLNLTVPLPLFDRNQGRLRETGALEERATKTVGALKRQIGEELADALQRVKTLAPLLESYTPDILQLAEANVKLVQEGYGQGLTNIVEVIQSRQQFAELKSSYIETLKEYHQAVNDLEIAAGMFSGTWKEVEKP